MSKDQVEIYIEEHDRAVLPLQKFQNFEVDPDAWKGQNSSLETKIVS